MSRSKCAARAAHFASRPPPHRAPRTAHGALVGMSYSFFDHTGDIGARLDAETPAHLFRSAAAAFTASITEPAAVRGADTRTLALESPDLDLLLVDFLGELLYLFDVQGFLVADMDIQLTPGPPAWRLQATVRGEVFDPARHGIKVLIKAITYHALAVTSDERGWHATVVFDI